MLTLFIIILIFLFVYNARAITISTLLLLLLGGVIYYISNSKQYENFAISPLYINKITYYLNSCSCLT